MKPTFSAKEQFIQVSNLKQTIWYMSVENGKILWDRISSQLKLRSTILDSTQPSGRMHSACDAKRADKKSEEGIRELKGVLTPIHQIIYFICVHIYHTNLLARFLS